VIYTTKEVIMEYRIVQDSDPLGREACDNLTKIVTAHKRSAYGDKNFSSLERLNQYIEENREPIEWAKKWGLVRSIFAYEHSGIWVRLDGCGSWPDQQWDCGRLGFIYVEPQAVVQLMGWKRINKDRAERLSSFLEQEFDEWKAYLEGDTYNVFNEAGDVEESGTLEHCQRFVAEMRSKQGEEVAA
jgi:hypothetical protein